MNALYLDTHVALWLYSKNAPPLPEVSKALIETNDLLISPMVFLEIQYLYEIGRINYTAAHIIDDLRVTIDLKIDDLPFEIAVRKASEIHWTRDPFDRLIAASAIAHNFLLITKDTHILENLSLSIWDTPRTLAHFVA